VVSNVLHWSDLKGLTVLGLDEEEQEVNLGKIHELFETGANELAPTKLSAPVRSLTPFNATTRPLPCGFQRFTSMNVPEDRIQIGQLRSAYGLNGWLWVYSNTEPMSNSAPVRSLTPFNATTRPLPCGFQRFTSIVCQPTLVSMYLALISGLLSLNCQKQM
jgi:hypothetical protein